MLETIEVKGAGMTKHYVTQLELQDLQERYLAIKERAKVWLSRVLWTHPCPSV
jgi:nesprin-1